LRERSEVAKAVQRTFCTSAYTKREPYCQSILMLQEDRSSNDDKSNAAAQAINIEARAIEGRRDVVMRKKVVLVEE